MAWFICFPVHRNRSGGHIPKEITHEAERSPLVIVLVAIIFIGSYSHRITGNAFLPPYVLYRTTATTAPHFTLLTPRSGQPHGDDEVLRDFCASEMNAYEVARARPFFAAVVRCIGGST